MRQRTVRGRKYKGLGRCFTTSRVYTRQQDFNKVDLMVGLGFTNEEDEEEAVQATSEGGDVTDLWTTF